MQASYRNIDSWNYVTLECAGIVAAIREEARFYQPGRYVEQDESEDEAVLETRAPRRVRNSSEVRSRGAPFTLQDKHLMAEYIASHPGRWEAPGTISSGWKEFALQVSRILDRLKMLSNVEQHTNHSLQSWVSFYRYRGNYKGVC